MNRREFIRSIVISSTLVATGVVGIAQMALLIQKNQSPISSTVQSSQAQSSSSTQTQSSPQTTQQQTSGITSTTTQQQSSTTSSASSQAPPGYLLITQLSTLAGQTSAYFTHPNFGSSIFVNVSSQWKAFSAICTHRPCTLDYRNSEIFCPCHGATFSDTNGSVLGGPAPRKIAEYGVQIIGNDVYVSTTTVN
ncbi:MAG TPA: Rieske (2Fe-2S) protein [Nitrososphaerales archaeon]|nr:Rieske (2Fe-2S) protein [Nitrososphaerales archaeon]